MTLIPNDKRMPLSMTEKPSDESKTYGRKGDEYVEIISDELVTTSGTFTDWSVSQSGATLSSSGTIFWYRTDNIVSLIGGLDIQTTSGSATGDFKLMIPFTTMPAYLPSGNIMTEIMSIARTDLTDLECALMVPLTFLSGGTQIEMTLQQKNQNLGAYPNWNVSPDAGFLYFRMMWVTDVAPTE